MDIRRMFTYDHNSSGRAVANLADVVYWDGNGVKTCSIDNWNTSLGTPVGVVVIPSGILPDGMARMAALTYTSSNSIYVDGSYSSVWGPDVDTGLNNYTKFPRLDSNQILSNNGTNYGFIPSDYCSAEQSIVDPDAYYSTTSSTKIPSPYSNGKLNPDYCVEISGNNALSDFNGLANTQTLVNMGTEYKAACAAYNYSDRISDCQWYLPAAGELGFFLARFKRINEIVAALGGKSTIPSYGMWSSTEYDSSNVIDMGTTQIGIFNGNVGYTKKSYTRSIRPFSLLNLSDNMPSQSDKPFYTVNVNFAWRKSPIIPNPNPLIYDGVYESYTMSGEQYSRKESTMYIYINGYTSFKLYIRSYAGSSCYVMVSELDQPMTENSSVSDTTIVKAHTQNNHQQGTSIDDYTLVEFDNIDRGNHVITIIYCKMPYASTVNDDRGYVLIPKNQ